jgi:hypothetical protein
VVENEAPPLDLLHARDRTPTAKMMANLFRRGISVLHIYFLLCGDKS